MNALKNVGRAFSLLLSLCITLSCLVCCAPQNALRHDTFDYFDTLTSLISYSAEQEEFDRAVAEVTAMLRELHRLYDIYNEYEGINNLCSLNSHTDTGEHPALRVDPLIVELLSHSKEMHRLTGGRVNIAMGSVLRLWQECRKSADSGTPTLPSEDELRAAALHTDISDLAIDPDSSTVILNDPQMLLDVGATAKGFAAQKIAERLADSGYSGYILNIGGNVCTIGEKAKGEKWAVGIEDPSSPDTSLMTLYLSDLSLVSSATHKRFFTLDGKRYHHIIDPATLMPSDRYLSVSLLCRDSALADALSTALFNMELSEGRTLVESMDGVEALWILSDGERVTSSGFMKYTNK